jgi:hypothetical protein
MRRAARSDSNQQEVVEALRRCGVQVEIIGFPVDLLCCDQRGRVHLVEVKRSLHGRLNPQTRGRWRGLDESRVGARFLEGQNARVQ